MPSLQLCVPTMFTNETGVASLFCLDTSSNWRTTDDHGVAEASFYGWGNDTATPVPPAWLPLYRCVSTAPVAGQHFLATSAGCTNPNGGSAVPDGLLGYISAAKDSTTPRSLKLCWSAKGNASYYHSLDNPCADGDASGVLLGFVM